MPNNEQFVGVPDVKVYLKKKSFQYVCPTPSYFDFDVSDFYNDTDKINIRGNNIEILNEVGIAMVKPLYINRNNYIDSFIKDVQITDQKYETLDDSLTKLFVEVPTGAPVETEEEAFRRVFNNFPTLHQQWQMAGLNNISLADYMPPFYEDNWEEDLGSVSTLENFSQNSVTYTQLLDFINTYDLNEQYVMRGNLNQYAKKYRGPIFRGSYHLTNGSKYPVSWINQDSSEINVEWFLVQRSGNFTNQSFWIDIKKAKSTKLILEDPKGYKREHRYGERKVDSYLAIRLGWYNPEDGYKDNDYVNNSDPFYRRGPYDIVFPIGSNPFIWDHGATVGDSSLSMYDSNGPVFEEETTITNDEGYLGFFDEDGNIIPLQEEGSQEEVQEETQEEEQTSKKRYPVVFKTGLIVSEKNSESWILKDIIDEFRLYFYCIRGKLVIYSSHAPNDPWVFPMDLSRNLSQELMEKYRNFFIPPCNVCIMGRGFKFMMNYNPLEFNIYDQNGIKKSPSGVMYSTEIMERKSYSGASGGGWLDTYEYKQKRNSGGAIQNFLLIPNAYRDFDTNGLAESFSYGFDVVSDGYDGIGGVDKGYTSMMIPVDGTNPHGRSFDPSDEECLVYTKLVSPSINNVIANKTIMNSFVGWETKTSTSELSFYNKFVEIGLNCRKPVIGPYTSNTTDRFASPVVWRFRGKHVSPTPRDTTAIDITNLVTSISYSMDCSDNLVMTSKATIDVIIPHKSLLTDYDIPSEYQSRTNLIKLLTGVREVIIQAGWKGGSHIDDALENPPSIFGQSISSSELTGKRITIFTGISTSGPLTQTSGMDSIRLTCSDKMKILETSPIINSPYFDGMTVEDAFFEVAQINGLPKTMFGVKSGYAKKSVLPIGYTFESPAMKFDLNTPVSDALKRIARMFMNVIQTYPDGKIVLTDLNKNSGSGVNNVYRLLESLPITHNSYIFYVEGIDSTNAFQRPYGQLVVNKDFTERSTSIDIVTVDRSDYSFLVDGRGKDINAIENPDSPDFIGYEKPFVQYESAFGTMENLNRIKRLYKKHFYQTPVKISFKTFGRPTLRPLDIIEVVFPDENSQQEYVTYNSADPNAGIDELTGRMKFRVISVSGAIDLNSEMLYSINVEAEHM